jgi:hypothetical protein
MLVRFVLFTLLLPAAGPQPPEVSDKSAQSAVEQKLDTQLLFEIYRRRGEAESRRVPPGDTGVRIDSRGRALVDVRAAVTAALHRAIRQLGGVVLSSSAPHQSTIARIPVLKLETLAADPTVRFIVPAAEATTGRQPATR